MGFLELKDMKAKEIGHLHPIAIVDAGLLGLTWISIFVTLDI